MEVKEDDVKGTVVDTYRCAKCNTIILVTPAVKINELFKVNWNCVHRFCVCGEELVKSVTTIVPIIDKIDMVSLITK